MCFYWKTWVSIPPKEPSGPQNTIDQGPSTPAPLFCGNEEMGSQRRGLGTPRAHRRPCCSASCSFPSHRSHPLSGHFSRLSAQSPSRVTLLYFQAPAGSSVCPTAALALAHLARCARPAGGLRPEAAPSLWRAWSGSCRAGRVTTAGCAFSSLLGEESGLSESSAITVPVDPSDESLQGLGETSLTPREQCHAPELSENFSTE